MEQKRTLSTAAWRIMAGWKTEVAADRNYTGKQVFVLKYIKYFAIFTPYMVCWLAKTLLQLQWQLWPNWIVVCDDIFCQCRMTLVVAGNHRQIDRQIDYNTDYNQSFPMHQKFQIGCWFNGTNDLTNDHINMNSILFLFLLVHKGFTLTQPLCVVEIMTGEVTKSSFKF